MENNFQSVANLSRLSSEISAVSAALNDSSLSSSSSLKSSSSFVRVFLENSTTVIEKKQNSLREALQKKLESRNIDIDSCIVYEKNTKTIIDFNDESTNSFVDYQDIIVRKRTDAEHNFTNRRVSIKDKLLFANRSCQFCLRASMSANECQKCELIVCQEAECVDKSKATICPFEAAKKNLRVKFLKLNKSKLMSIARPAILKRKRRPAQPGEQTTTPTITQIEFTPRIRIRSFSDPDISNMMISANEHLKKEMNHERIEKAIIREESYEEALPATPTTPPYTPDTPTKSPKPKRPHRWSSLLNWEIPSTRIKIHKHYKLGHGSFGVVHKGTDFYHGVVAVKFLNVSKPSPHQVAAFKNEVAILKSTRHENILLFIGCFLSDQLAIVTEWCPGSSLYRHLHVDEVLWDMCQLIDIARQTSTGMEYLHAKDILHRDLKSNNIFLVPNENGSPTRATYNRLKKNMSPGYDDASSSVENELVSEWTVKIGDFGLATVKSMDTEDTNNVNHSSNKRPTGSVLWMAPEVINQKVNDPYTHKSDVYSFAVVLYELVTSSLPFQNFHSKEPNMILFWVGRGKLKLDLESSRADTPEEIKELIMTCSDYDRDKRLDFVDITKRLKKIRLSRPKDKKIPRVQSTPNIYFNFDLYWPSSSKSTSTTTTTTSTASHMITSLGGGPLSPSTTTSSASSIASPTPRFFPPNFVFTSEHIEIDHEIYSDITNKDTVEIIQTFSPR